MDNIYSMLVFGILECLNSKKYKSKSMRRHICERYNLSISYVLNNVPDYVLSNVGRQTVIGCKGLITEKILGNLDDEELGTYIIRVVCPILRQLFESFYFEF